MGLIDQLSAAKYKEEGSIYTSSIHVRAEKTNCGVSLPDTFVYDIPAQTSPTHTLGPNVPEGCGPGSGPRPKSGAPVDVLVEDGVPGVEEGLSILCRVRCTMYKNGGYKSQ